MGCQTFSGMFANPRRTGTRFGVHAICPLPEVFALLRPSATVYQPSGLRPLPHRAKATVLMKSG